MNVPNIKDLVDRYIAVSFSVEKKAASLVKNQIGSDLTNDQHFTLRYINQVGSCTSSELAEVFDVKKSAITAMITRMWEKGLIQRTRDENDRRVVYLTLTEKGNELYVKAEEKIHNLVESLINRFDQAEIQQFIETFEKLDKVLSQSNGQ
ncbi:MULTISPECIES: MarR family winged helix-turn-helix transcriptional regulator [Bacillaceae]|uniref:MarR family transcriptional regulator n=1 Tax=Cytobacillus oceanisediminis TaxID=665099 RepID=A0ABX3CV51_9BACI|nr:MULTISPECIES: MarR family transcriptional regulator [Bacillaceae]EFV78369.1 transcriptional regulator protein [Bacillus sp. 2_A_57_CT2]MBU8730893.1 MarR family transcriptional regulator [Cytobacillus oceanisediminis]MBX9974263.1 MarR family transcriptional regulator [Cytobacillus firmus]MBY0159060.1 MarR family transcriptional regulator [Cytobacillus firmus]MCM3244352.1 MarR family transcriptional regulator [Cytobacillus oceanisediminis]